MSRLNTITHLVTEPRFNDGVHLTAVKDESTVVGVSKNNYLVYIWYTDTGSERVRIPKKEVVQIVAGFSEIA